MKTKSSLIIQVVFPLFFGGLIYISFRDTSLIMFDWFNLIGIIDYVNLVRETLQPVRQHIPEWIYYSLPDGLWVYAFTSILHTIWGKNYTKLKYWLILPITFGILMEVAQAFNIVRGTFDFLDLILCMTAFILSILLNNDRENLIQFLSTNNNTIN